MENGSFSKKKKKIDEQDKIIESKTLCEQMVSVGVPLMGWWSAQERKNILKWAQTNISHLKNIR